jgi:hypothetical protein
MSFNQQMEDELLLAYQHAKKGVYWGLSNLKGKKTKFENKLISQDKLIATIKISKEINGAIIESTGHNESSEVTIIVHRSYDSLVKEGFIEKNSELLKDNSE